MTAILEHSTKTIEQTSMRVSSSKLTNFLSSEVIKKNYSPIKNSDFTFQRQAEKSWNKTKTIQWIFIGRHSGDLEVDEKLHKELERIYKIEIVEYIKTKIEGYKKQSNLKINAT